VAGCSAVPLAVVADAAMKNVRNNKIGIIEGQGGTKARWKGEVGIKKDENHSNQGGRGNGGKG